MLTMMRYMNCSFSPIEGAKLLLPLEPFSIELTLPLMMLPPPLLLTLLALLPAMVRAEVGTFSRRMEMATGPRLSSSPNQFWCSANAIQFWNVVIFVNFYKAINPHSNL